jgi:hypothetical protein
MPRKRIRTRLPVRQTADHRGRLATIFSEADDRLLSDTELTAWLNDHGIPALNGGAKWQRIQVVRLRNQFRAEGFLCSAAEYAGALERHVDVLKNTLAMLGRVPDKADQALCDAITWQVRKVEALSLALSRKDTSGALPSDDVLGAFARARELLRRLVMSLAITANGFNADLCFAVGILQHGDVLADLIEKEKVTQATDEPVELKPAPQVPGIIGPVH